MFFRLLKKISKNKGIFLSLLIGVVLSLVVINATIIYGNSLKDSLFQQVLGEFEEKNNVTAGSVIITDPAMNLNNGFSKEVEAYDQSVLSKLDLDVETGKSYAYLSQSVFWDPDANTDVEGFYRRGYDLIAMSDFVDHVDLIQGEMFKATEIEDNELIVEVMVDQKTLVDLKLEVGKLYKTAVVKGVKYVDVLTAANAMENDLMPVTYFKIVGVYEVDLVDNYWKQGLWKNDKHNFVIHENTMNILKREWEGKVTVSREYFIDFSTFKYSDREKTASELQEVYDLYESRSNEFQMNLTNTLNRDNKNFALVSNMLWIIQIPVFAILFLYILMLTGIIVERDKDEIALLKSRGATKLNILSNYLFDGFMVLMVGLIIAPAIAMFAAEYMSVTSGFLEFKGDASANLYFTKENLYFSLLAGLFFLCALLIPVIKATRVSIIDRKQSKVRIRFSTWKKTYIDFILVGLAFYGFRMFKESKAVAENIELNINSVTLDPLIFVSATIFAFGLSLLFLRVYPLIIKLLFKGFKKIMPPNIFVLFSNLGRKPGKREYVMLFIMVMICSSIFNLKIARTINNNVVDNIRYSNGSEVRIRNVWSKEQSHSTSAGEDLTKSSGSEFDSLFDVLNLTELIEPDFSQYEDLDSLSHVTKVMTIKNTTLFYRQGSMPLINMIAIEPKAFGEIAFMRDDLSPVHWYEYLNVIAKDPSIVFISSNAKDLDKHGLKPGDPIKVKIYGFEEVLYFGGYIDYWPGQNMTSGQQFMVGNFNYAYSRLARLPYEIWGSLEPGYTEKDLLEEMRQKEVNYKGIDGISSMTKGNIFLKAVNASITISFILLMVVTLMGYVIYWVISIKDRELQFGILRSLGMKIRKIYLMILLEQVLVTGISLLVGIGIGQYISGKFLPAVTDIVFGKDLIIPVLDYIEGADYLLIISLFTVSVVIVLAILLRYISSIKISQAIKIGED